MGIHDTVTDYEQEQLDTHGRVNNVEGNGVVAAEKGREVENATV